MNRFLLSEIFGLLLVVSILAACSGLNDGSSGKTTTSSGNTLYCSASFSGSSASTTVPVYVYGSGGTSPYYVSGFSVGGTSATSLSGSTTFTSSTSLTGNFSSSVSSGASGTVTIYDAAGSTTSCYFTVSTSSSTTTSSSNACSIYASSSYPYLNQSVTFTMQSTSGWGTAPYTFYQLSAGSGTSSGITQTSTTVSSATVTFYSAGTQNISVYVRDYYGNTGYCSTSVTVNSSTSSGSSSGCSVSFSQNPVYRGQAVVVTGTSLSGTPVYLNSVYGPTGQGITGSITSSNAATLYFPYAGSYLLTLYMTSAYGQTMSCTGTQVVY